MKRESVKTVAEWRESIKKDAQKRGGWRMLSVEMFNSQAFIDLTPSGKMVVLSMLSKLSYEKRGHRDRKGVKAAIESLRNGGRFSLVGNELKARGIKSERSITDAKAQAWEFGFFDVEVSGSFDRAGTYKYSERWKLYPHGDYRPRDARRPGVHRYHSISDSSVRVENTRRKHAKNTRRDSDPPRVNTTRSKAQNPEPPRVISTRDYKLPLSTTGTAHSKPTQTTEAGGPLSEHGMQNHIDPAVLSMGIPKEIAGMFASYGAECTRAQRFGRELTLGFDNGHVIHVRPTSFELVRPDASVSVCKNISALAGLLSIPVHEST